MPIHPALRKIILPLALFWFLAACSAVTPQPGSSGLSAVSGKLTVDQQPLAGAWLEAFPVGSASLAGKPPYRSPATGADGLFELALPPGEYYLLAAGNGCFAYYGRNPVTVPAEGLSGVNLALVAVDDVLPEADPFITSGVFGRVSHAGQPLAGATVYVYLDLTSQLKGMGYVMVGPTGPDGLFEATLPAGSYYLLARKRSGGSGLGPLRAGDFMGYYPGNPVKVADGQIVRLAIPLLEVPEKVDQLAGSLFGSTVLRGVIRNRDGQPLAGLRAVLYDDPQMLNRPLFVSRPTGPDGAFVLSFPHGGTYYLAARNTLGGAPGPGDLYGTWDGSPDHALQINEGETREGLEIVVEEMW